MRKCLWCQQAEEKLYQCDDCEEFPGQNIRLSDERKLELGNALAELVTLAVNTLPREQADPLDDKAAECIYFLSSLARYQRIGTEDQFQEAMTMQEKLKAWIAGWKERDGMEIMTMKEVVEALEEFEVET